MKLKDFNKKQLLKMRTAVKLTKSLHEKAVDTRQSYEKVRDARQKEIIRSGGDCEYPCPLCAFDVGILDNCSACPWNSLSGKYEYEGCTTEGYRNSPKSIKRLTRWLTLIQEEIDSRSKKP